MELPPQEPQPSVEAGAKPLVSEPPAVSEEGWFTTGRLIGSAKPLARMCASSCEWIAPPNGRRPRPAGWPSRARAG